MGRTHPVSVLCLLLSPILSLSLSLPSFFGTHMVLQHSKKVSFFGVDTPGSQVTVTLLGVKYPATTQSDGTWSVVFPATAPTTPPTTIQIVSSGGDAIQLDDVIFGDVYVCSGQSNMQLAVIETENYATTLNETPNYADRLRIIQVNTDASYPNVRTPQTNLSLNIPWSRVSSSTVPWFSAYCYYYGLNVVKNGGPPVGMIASSWGGTAIEVWMGPDSLSACGEALSSSEKIYQKNSFLPRPQSMDDFPTAPSCLYYSMIYPLLPLPITGILWYQGEANAGNPVNYSNCFPAMISEWRQVWSQKTNSQTDPNIPFFFAQLSSWANGDNGMIPIQRYAQMSALKLPKVAMAVTADLGDAASAIHPIHPIYKAEVGRRSWLAGWNLVYGNSSSPLMGPQLTKTQVDLWDSSWGDYHYGMGIANVCTPGTGFTCLGIRLTFDQPLFSLPLPQRYVNGFDLITDTGLLQPVSYTNLRDNNYTIQLNVTVTSGNLQRLLYAWHDYPIMPFYGVAFNLPIAPFNLTFT